MRRYLADVGKYAWQKLVLNRTADFIVEEDKKTKSKPRNFLNQCPNISEHNLDVYGQWKSSLRAPRSLVKVLVALCKMRDRFSDLEHPYGNDSNTHANRRFPIGAKESAQKKVVTQQRSHPLHMKSRVMNAGKSTAQIATHTATQRTKGYIRNRIVRS